MRKCNSTQNKVACINRDMNIIIYRKNYNDWRFVFYCDNIVAAKLLLVQ